MKVVFSLVSFFCSFLFVSTKNANLKSTGCRSNGFHDIIWSRWHKHEAVKCSFFSSSKHFFVQYLDFLEIERNKCRLSGCFWRSSFLLSPVLKMWLLLLLFVAFKEEQNNSRSLLMLLMLLLLVCSSFRFSFFWCKCREKDFFSFFYKCFITFWNENSKRRRIELKPPSSVQRSFETKDLFLFIKKKKERYHNI